MALWDGSAWVLVPPLLGWRCYIEAEEREVIYTASGWDDPVLQGSLLGLNASADGNNRLAVSSPGVLFSHAGTDHRLKVNKAAAGHTASLLFQTGYSGRAEMGTAGADDFSVKVSADGSLWQEALRAVATSGRVEFPNGAQISGSLGGTAVVQSLSDTTANRLTVVGWMGLGAGALLSTNLNSLSANGFYRVAASGGTNAPTAHSYLVLHEQADSNVAVQLAFGAEASGAIAFWRQKHAGTWQAWRRIFDTQSILGSVSESSGLPSGAILEKGSNANGSFTRFADGTLICRSGEITLQANVAEGAIFKSATSLWTFPSAFSGPCTVAVGAGVGGQAWASAALSDATPSGALLRCHSAVSMGAGQGFYATAMGRWY